jgi:hypothetical protein
VRTPPEPEASGFAARRAISFRLLRSLRSLATFGIASLPSVARNDGNNESAELHGQDDINIAIPDPDRARLLGVRKLKMERLLVGVL